MYKRQGDFPRYGNDDDRADEIAIWLLKTFMGKLKKCHTYRNSEPTTSILTITSNVVYGKATGSLPDGRKAGEPLAPGANPSYGAEPVSYTHLKGKYIEKAYSERYRTN